MGLFKVPGSKKWHASFTDLRGDQHRITCETTNKREAQRILEEKKSQALNGILPPSRRNSPVLRSWFDELLPTKQNESTRDRYSICATHLCNFFGSIRICDITPLALTRYQQERLRDGASPATVNREISVCSWALQKARRMQLISRNPCSDVEALNERNTRRQAQPLSYEEEAALLLKCPTWLRMFIIFLIETGLRAKKEAFPLRWTDVDLEAQPAFVVVRNSKTPAGSRKVWLTQRCRNELSKWHILLGPDYSPYVFPALTDPSRHLTWYKEAWRVATSAAGLTGRRVHDLRSTFATRINSCGVSTLTVAQLLGHSSGSTAILPTYVKELDENTRAVIKNLDEQRLAFEDRRRIIN